MHQMHVKIIEIVITSGAGARGSHKARGKGFLSTASCMPMGAATLLSILP